MSDEEREEGWSPFRVSPKPVDRYVAPDPTKAIEIHPIIVMNNRTVATPQPVAPKEDEAEAPAETDPKAKISSATSTAEVSEIDSSKSSLQPIQTQPLTHPSSLPPDADNPVSAEKDQTPPVLAFTPMNLG